MSGRRLFLKQKDTCWMDWDWCCITVLWAAISLRYFIKLYALDTKLVLQPGAQKTQIIQAIAGHVLASAELIGRYARP